MTTTLGILSYTELAPHLARRVEALEAAIIQDGFSDRALDEDLLRDLHAGICADLVPQFAGRWRRADVRVSDHQPPSYPQVPMLMRNYCRDLTARFAALRDPADDRIPEFLAFAEGRILSIHPFADFNGRTTRIMLAELLHRLDLPALDPTPDPGPESADYLAALKAADQSNWQPLIEIWLERFAKETRS